MSTSDAGAAVAELETYGVVLLVDDDGRIAHVSASCGVILGSSREQLVGAPLSDVIDGGDVAALRDSLTTGIEAVGWRRIALTVGGAMKLHAFDPGPGLVGLDLLPLPVEVAAPDAQAVERVSAWSNRLIACRSVDELLGIAATLTRELTDFNGAWVSRKEEDGRSVLLSADVVNAPPAVGQSVQPGDAMPAQPRLRGRPIPFFVADLAAEATHLSPALPHDVDLTGSLLIRPYPAFLARMMSFGVRSIASIPIVVSGEMWGRMIALHPSARRVAAATQAELGLLGVAIGARLHELLAQEDARERTALSRRSGQVVQAIAATDDLVDGLARAGEALPETCAAHAAVASIGGRTVVVGDLGARSDAVAGQLLEIARTALRRPDAEATVCATTFGGVEPVDSTVAAGYLAVRLDSDAGDVLLWTRAEEQRAVTWADPQVVEGGERDELFTDQGERVEHQAGACPRWSAAQQQHAGELREAIGEILIARYTQIRSLNAELARSNEEYDAFAHAVAHDLRAPLRAIGQNAEFLREDAEPRLEAEERTLLDTIIRLTGRTNDLLDDLMSYAQVGSAAWVAEPVDLRDAVAQVTELLGPRLAHANVTAAPAMLVSDPAALRQLLLNLIGNAVKYSDGPATIDVGVTTLAAVAGLATVPDAVAVLPEDTQVLTVADRGIGIAPEHHERIFRLFHQLDPHAEGTGTGLAICRLVCRRHGGDLWLDSAAGVGTTFYVVVGA